MVSFCLGLAIPERSNEDLVDYKNHWQVNEWWRFMFGFPLVLVVIQLIFLIFVFPYDSPKILKQTNQTEKLYKVMRKLYDEDQVQRRIDDILT